MGLKGPLSAASRVYPPGRVKGRPLGRRAKGSWPEATKSWWEDVSTLPHTVDWSPGDWQHARATAQVHAAVFEGGTAALWAELRVREERLGVTEVGRSRLGIAYAEEPGKPKAHRRSAAELRLVKDDAVQA